MKRLPKIDLGTGFLELPEPWQGNFVIPTLMALHLQITALMSVLEEVQLASRVHRELGMYAKRPEDGKEDVLISAVLVFVLEEICGACHLCPLEILQARLRARDIRSCPDVLRFTCRVKATDHGGQSGVRSQVLRLETCPQLHHLELCGIETSQLLFIVAAGLQQIHVGKHWYVRNRVQHVGEGHILNDLRNNFCQALLNYY